MTAIIAPSDFVRQYAPWSVSKADSAKQCPHKFWFNYVVKQKKGKAPPSPEATKGRAGHKALEYALSGRPVSKSLQFAAEEFKLTTPEIEELEMFRPAMENFMRKFTHYCNKHETKEILVEKELAVGFEGQKVKYWGKDCFIRGVADVIVLFKNEPYALILDHKTGKVRDRKYYENQFNTYIMMLKAFYPYITKVMTGIHWLKGDSIDIGRLIEVPDLEPLVSRTITLCNESTSRTHNFEETRRSGLCGWCDFRYLCPDYPESDADGHEDQKEEGNLPGAAQENMGTN
jgi:CRISPR/Cas system-associated exonuclease Cas4 (RecB family)